MGERGVCGAGAVGVAGAGLGDEVDGLATIVALRLILKVRCEL